MKKIFCALLASLFFVGFSQASTLDEVVERGVLRVGFNTGYQPFEMVNKKGDYIGFDVDIAKQMAKAMGVKVEFVNTAWDGIIPALLTKKFDIVIAGMTITPQRNLRVNFSDPYIVIGQSIAMRKELSDEVTKPRDLNNKSYKLAVVLGTTGHEAAKKYFPKAQLFEYESHDEARLEVLNGKLDAFVYDLTYNALFAAQNPEKVAFISEPFTYEPLAWAVRRGDADYINWLNNFLQQIKGDGTYDRFYAKWFESDRWVSTLK